MATPLPVPSYLSSEQDYALLAQRESLFAPHARLAFEVLEKLGEGGMGAVYKVRDKRLGRLAALKVLANEKADQNAQTRFLREARVTARLDHPSIPPVHEAGRTAGGELYMLMRLIQGQTLSQRIRDLHDQGCPQSGLTELLQALVKVAEAISYAHSQGIVHRDLKPDNIMIGAFGEVLVLDWGIASVSGIKDQGEGLDLADSSLAEISGLTQAGSFLGTPGYAAPEQIDGDPIDGRADVFALGLLLTEVLTGQAAISGDTGMDRARATASGSISRPREILSSVPHELDFISAQATAIDRDERTASAKELTDQFKAYHNGAPIPSYPYNLSEKITRGARRHPLLLLGLLMGALTLSLAILLQGALRESARKQEELTASRLKEEKARADAGAAQIAEAKAKAEAEKSKKVSELFNEAQGLARRGINPEKVKELTEQAIDLGGRTYGNLLTASKIYSNTGKKDTQRRLLEECTAISNTAYEALFELHVLEMEDRPSSFELTPFLVTLIQRSKDHGDENEFTLLAQGSELQQNGDKQSALAAYNKAEKYSIRLTWLYNNRGNLRSELGDKTGVLADYNKAIDLDPRYAVTYTNRGNLRSELGDKTGAHADYDKSIELDSRSSPAFTNRGGLRSELGDKAGAITDYNTAIELDSRNSKAYFNRGLLRSGLGDITGARADYDKAIDLDPRYAKAYYSRALLRFKFGDKNGAQADYDKAIEFDPQHALTYNNRGILRSELGDKSGAHADYDKSIELDSRSAPAFNNRGLLRHELGDHSGALADYDKAIELDPRYAVSYANRAHLRSALADHAGALADYDKAIDLDPRYAAAYINRGNLRSELGNSSGARADFETAIEIDPKLALAYANRGVLFQTLGDLPAALKDFQSFLQLSPNHPAAPRIRKNISEIEKSLNQQK